VSETTRSKALTTNIITSDSTVGNRVRYFFNPINLNLCIAWWGHPAKGLRLAPKLLKLLY